ncbi:MAG: Fic/DOC family protein [Bryobacteraceae bacterium]
MDPYVYPGTNVLRNLRDIRDPDTPNEFEAEATSRRIRQLEHKPLPGAFDTTHLQAIHHHIFKDVFPWAGEFRTVNISRPDGVFAFREYILPSLNKALGELQKERCLSGTGLRRFSNRAAHYMGEINAIHPFRDGNGRSQREFIRQLALRNGYALDWSRVSGERIYEGSRRSFQRGDNAGLEEAIRGGLDNERNKAEEKNASAFREWGDAERER